MVELKVNKDGKELVTEMKMLGSTTEIIKELSVGFAQSIMRLAEGDKDKALSMFDTFSEATVMMMAIEYIRQTHSLGGEETGIGIKMPVTQEMYEKLKERFKK